MTAKVLTVLELYFGKENKEKCITINNMGLWNKRTRK